MTGISQAEDEISRLHKRLERERKARLEAELITERVTRAFYEKQQELELLRSIAVTANEAVSIEAALQAALQKICAYTHWPVGHIFIQTAEGTLASTEIWYLQHPERFNAFRFATEGMVVSKGVGLPGRAQERARLVWIEDVTRDDNFPRAPLAQACGLKGAFAFPLFVGNDVAAVMEFFSTEPLKPEVSFLSVISDIGSQLGRVIERQRGADSLRQQEKAEAAKSEFLANMSHELLTPMNGILGMTELVLETKLTSEQKDYIDIVRSSADGLLTLINDMLDFSKIEAHNLELFLRPFSLHDALGDMLPMLARHAHSKGLELIYYLQPDVPEHLIGDTARLRQILINLVGNAIKFTEHGEIVVRVKVEFLHQQQLRLHFMVTDTGIGIPQDSCQKIFEAFTQVDGSTTRKYGGTGLGLSISHKLVELMHGQIWVESEFGKGSTFHFTANFEVNVASGHAKKAEMAATAHLNQVPVLVVAGNAAHRQVLGEIMTGWTMRPAMADSGAKALEELRRTKAIGQPYALLLIDVMSPGVEGFKLIEQVQQDATLSGLNVVALLPSVRPESAARCRELGVSNYLYKPVKQSLLLAAIEQSMRAHPYVKPEPPALTPASMPAVAEPRRALKILLAEDNYVNQKLAARLLEKQGHQVIIADNGRDALALFDQERFDVVLMDIQMPLLNGLEATAAIREREKQTGTHIPIIAVTANAMKGDRETFLAAGMDGFVPKPIRIQMLYHTIEELVYAA